MLFSAYPFSHLLLITALALLCNLILGGPRSFYLPLRELHPLTLWELFSSWLAGKMNRYRRSDHTRKMRGGWLVFLTILLSLILGESLHRLFLSTGVSIEIILLALFISSRQQADEMTEINRLLIHTPGKVDSAVLPPLLVRRQLREYDHATVLRGSIEALALGLSERVVAPLFFYLLAGWHGVILVTFITVLDARFGYRNSQYESFGAIAAKTHTFLQFIPSRLASGLLALAAFFAPACRGKNAWRIMTTHAKRAASHNAGWPIAAMAGALGIVLGGPRALYGSFIADHWIGEGTAQLIPQHTLAARWLYMVAHFVLIMTLMLCGLVL